MVECSMQFFQLTGTYLITVLDLVATQSFPSVFSSEVVGCMPIDDSYVIDIDSTIPQTDFKYM